MADYIDRYAKFNLNGKYSTIPYTKLSRKTSDKEYIYRSGVSRMDKISFEYYGTPLFGWLIMYANPQFGGLEHKIPDSAIITVPFPLVETLKDLDNRLSSHIEHYGR